MNKIFRINCVFIHKRGASLINPRNVVGETRDPGLKINVTNLFRQSPSSYKPICLIGELGSVLEYICRVRIETIKPHLTEREYSFRRGDFCNTYSEQHNKKNQKTTKVGLITCLASLISS